MTVAEMIEKLQAFSPDAEVYATFRDESPFQRAYTVVGEVYEIKGHKQYSGVFLET